MILSNDSLVAFHYRTYGTFFLHKNRLHNIYRGFTHYKYYRAKKIPCKMKLQGTFVNGYGQARWNIFSQAREQKGD